jgi:hypothetical protein
MRSTIGQRVRVATSVENPSYAPKRTNWPKLVCRHLLEKVEFTECLLCTLSFSL